MPELDREIAELRNRIDLMEPESGEVGEGLGSLVALARVALLQAETRRATRQLIVSQIDGEVMALGSTRGAYLAVGAAVAQIRTSGESSLEAVLLLAPRMARRLSPGMTAAVEVLTPAGDPLRLDGKVVEVGSGAVPSWLAALQPHAPDPALRVGVMLDEMDLGLPDGTPCRVSVHIDRRPAAALLDLVEH